MHFLVFSHTQVRDDIQMVNVQPIGVYVAESAEKACKAAAMQVHSRGTFVAIEAAWMGRVELLDEGESIKDHVNSGAVDDD